jgi:hypothetical protein
MRNRSGFSVALALGCLLASAAMAAAAQKVVIGKHGQTHADPTLQNDVITLMHTAVPVLTQRLAGPAAIACGKMTRIDTVVTKMVTNDAWSETWTYVVCDTQIAIPIDFVPSPKGGTDFTLRTKDVVVGPAGKQ